MDFLSNDVVRGVPKDPILKASGIHSRCTHKVIVRFRGRANAGELYNLFTKSKKHCNRSILVSE